MAIAFVQAATLATHDAQSSTVAITLTGVTNGNTLVLFGSVYNTATGYTISGVSDGSAFTVRSGLHTDTGHRQYSVVAFRVNVGAGSHTVTVTLSGANGGDTYAELGLAEFSGVDNSTPEVTFDSNSDINITSTDVSAGPVTSTATTDLFVGAAEVIADSATSLAWSSPTSWTNLYRKNDGFSSGTGHDSGYWLPGSVQTTYTAQWAHRNISGGNEGSAVVVVLKAAAGGGGGITGKTHVDGIALSGISHIDGIAQSGLSGINRVIDRVRAIGAGWKRHGDGRLLVPAYPS